VVVRGRNVTPGYWRRPEATAALFLPGGWLRTGDAGYLDDGGYLTIADRIKDIIISGGENVIPGEVERVLAEHDGVLEAAVVGAPDADGLIRPKAFVVVKPGTRADDDLAEALEYHAKAMLAPFKCPRWIAFLDELPKTATGKIQRFKLREDSAR